MFQQSLGGTDLAAANEIPGSEGKPIEDDVLASVRHALRIDDLAGPVNVVAPNPVRNDLTFTAHAEE